MKFFENRLTDLSFNLRRNQVDLFDFLLEICDRLEATEPQIQAFLPEKGRRARLIKEAKSLIAQYPTTDNRPPLFGIPVGIKDLIHVDGMETRGGSNLPPLALQSRQASLVSHLKKQGALILGKTTTEEFAYAGAPQTKNPHNWLHTPGGSSSGSAASVSVGSCPFAVGTQTLRSVIAPASFCGIVGFKPSYGRIPVDGTLLLSPSFDTYGFFTQTVESMHFVCTSLFPGWSSTTMQTDMDKPVLGIPKGVYMTLMFDEAKKAFDEKVAHLKQVGYIVKEVDMPWKDSFIMDESMISLLRAEMAEVHKEWFIQYEYLYNQATRNAIRKGQEVSAEFVQEVRKYQVQLRRELKVTMEREGIDIWISPAQAGAAPEGYKKTGWAGMTAIWSFSGLPTLSIPRMEINRMPLGFQCVGKYERDELLLHWASKIDFDLKQAN